MRVPPRDDENASNSTLRGRVLCDLFLYHICGNTFLPVLTRFCTNCESPNNKLRKISRLCLPDFGKVPPVTDLFRHRGGGPGRAPVYRPDLVPRSWGSRGAWE